LIYHELDFAANTSSKISTISHSSILLQRIPAPITILPAGDTLHSPQYYIHPYDLRTLDSSRQSSLLPHIDPLLPTLLISECCLCYLTPVTADSVVAFFAHLFPARTPLGMLLYEPINPFDGFGRVMVSNLAARGIELHTLERYGSLEAQRERLRKYGFSDGVRAMDVDALWEQRVTAEEKQRVGGLEMVDEVEEWRLLAQHYCVAWGWRDKERNGEGADEEERGRAAEEGEKGKELQNTKADEAESKNNHDNDNDDVWKKWRTET
jgi:[phosphatase 2A protein]-leucine-carboxy methyltransferase